MVHIEREVKSRVSQLEAHTDNHTKSDRPVSERSSHNQTFWHAKLRPAFIDASVEP